MLEVEKEEKKELFGRKEVIASFFGESLSFDQAKGILADKFKTNTENIAVKGINRKFGSPELSILAYLYDSKDLLNKFEPKIKEKTDGVKALEERKKEQEKAEKLKKMQNQNKQK